MRTGTVSYKLEDLRKGVIIPIGMVGENDFTRVIFDAEEVFKKHPDAQVTMKVQPPKGGIYPATVTRDGNTVIWQVKAADVAHRGSGELQLTFTADTMVEKSYIAKTDIKRSLVGNGPAPDPVQDWVDNAEEVLEDLEAAEVHQPIIGEDGYWYTWNQETEEYEKTDTKAQGADGQPGQDGAPGRDGTDATPDLITKDYADLTFPVAEGTYCYHSGLLYYAKQDIQTSEAWTAAHWQQTTVEEQQRLLLNDIQQMHTVPSGGSSGQVLGKASGTDYDLEWKTVSGGGTVDSSLNVESTNPVQNKDLAQTIVERALISSEVGTFDSSTGAEKESANRIRTINFIDNNATKIILNNPDQEATPAGILIYAWDSSDNYIGFWGGSGFVKSGSQYIETVDLTYFRTNYPTYKFKAVCAKSYNNIDQQMTTLYGNSIYTRLNSVEPVKNTNLSWVPTLKNGSFSIDYEGTITIASSTTRVYTENNIPKSVKTIACLEGYCFLLYAMAQDGKTYGSYKEDGSFYLGGTSKILTQFDVSKYDYYGYRLIIRKTNGSATITPKEAQENILLLPVSTEKNTGTDNADIFTDADNNMCLCAIKKDLTSEKIPYNRGYLFHKFSTADDNKLWYAKSLNGMKEVCRFPADPRSLRFAISPKDGTIIATNRDARSGLWIYTPQRFVKLDSFPTNPMGWLYNSGVDFISDGTDEYCIFAEYNGNTSPDMTFRVWKGTHPYTSASNWKVITDMTQTRQDITHFHMVRRDPWTNVLYLTSGDANEECKWWYSEDYGENWTLLTSGQTSGFEDHICRCINFIFTEDYVYWATDKGTNHCLNKAERDQNGIIDPSTRVKVCDLPSGYATNFLCYVESPKGLFMYDRVDIGYTSQYGDPVALKFYDLNDNTLKDVVTMPLSESTWGGCRGKCYIDYTNSVQPFPAMGYSPDTPCIFDIVTDDLDNIGTIIFDPACKRFYTATLE